MIKNFTQMKYTYITTILFPFLLFLTGCEQEEKITVGPLPEVVSPSNPTDQKIAEILDKYQSKIIYRWDRRYTSSDAKVVPPKFELVLPFVQLMEQFWINPYESQKSGFMRDNMPIEVVLVGSTIRYHEGEEQGFNAAGQALSLSRVLLAGVNEYDLKDEFWLREQVKTMHHEFAHILDKKYGRPNGFDDISKGKYAGNTSFLEFSMETARERGFWVPYGMSNEEEDFATFVEGLISTSEDDFSTVIQDNDLLKRKYDMVNQYFLQYGIDIHKIQENLNKQIENFLIDVTHE